jgi:hypothetical protein
MKSDHDGDEGNMARSQTVPLRNPGLSTAQPTVVNPIKKSKVRFYKKPVPKTTGRGVGNPPKNPIGPSSMTPTAKASTKMQFPVGAPIRVGRNPRPLGPNKKISAIYGG